MISGIGTSRSPVNQGPNGALGQEKEVSRLTILFEAPHSPTPQDLNNTLMSGQRNFSDPQQLQQRQQQAAEGQDASTTAAQSVEQPPLTQMSDLDRFGLAGLLRMIHSESPDVASLAVGQDLMTLGLDLNQPEYAYLSLLSFCGCLTMSLRPVGRYILRSHHHLCRLCLQYRWNKTSPCRLATMSPISNHFNLGSLDLVMRLFSTSSIACRGISCRKWLQRS